MGLSVLAFHLIMQRPILIFPIAIGTALIDRNTPHWVWDSLMALAN